MARLVFPLSRIEGHAQVVIEVRHGEVTSASFQAMEMRGFEYLIQGVPAEQMPVIVPRICGVCSTAHHVASVKALENTYGVEPPPLALKLRELLLLGQLIQNQATSLFIFTMPDRLGLSSIFQPEVEGASDFVRRSVAEHALEVRKAGTDLISLAGGQFIHPIKAIVGGMTSGVPKNAAEKVRDRVIDALPLACMLFNYYWDMSMALRERIGTWGDDAPAYYLAATGSQHPNYCGGAIRVMNVDGKVSDSFPARNYRAHLSFEETDYSYAEQSNYKGHVMRANSLARINMTESFDLPCADVYLERFQREFGKPAHAILLFDLARGIDLVYALERAIEILIDPLDKEETGVPYTARDGEGFGVVEAPRGPLIHHYRIENGLIAGAKFIIPTVHNLMAIERALRVVAERYITPDGINMELEHAVGRVVRAFDPCIACATH